MVDSGICSVVPVNGVVASILVDEAINGVDVVTSMFSLMLTLWEVCTDAIMMELSVEFVTRTFIFVSESVVSVVKGLTARAVVVVLAGVVVVVEESNKTRPSRWLVVELKRLLETGGSGSSWEPFNCAMSSERE